ncbi:MAG: VWA domain-containing protein [Lautropia sp.]
MIRTTPGDGVTHDQPALSSPARRHHFGDNVVHFARILRAAGLPAGPERVLRALEALELVGVSRRDDVHAALSAVMIDRHEQQALFDAAFAAFWRDPKLLERLMYLALPKVSGRGQREDEAARARRLQEALSPRPTPASTPQAPQSEEQKFEAELTWSDRERLQQADFASMSTEEFEQAQRLARNLSLPLRPLPTRRRAPSLTGRPDLRRMMQRTLRAPDSLLPAYSAPRRRPPPLVLLVDISGSMERYTRLFLHFAHGLSQQQRRVHTLVFGTRLTNITHCLRHRDPDLAMARADAMVQDWRGGTRIASNLRAFNRLWARRLLTGNAALILVTDGLDRDDAGDLGHEAALLSRFCHQMIWLNPLLRFEGFAPRAAGIRAIMPHVDQFLPMHNLASLADLGHELRSRHYKEIAT